MPDQQVVIRPGMSEALDPRHLPIGTPRLLQNVRIRQGARFEKRPGTASLGTTGLPTSNFATWIGSYGGNPVVGIEETTTTTRRDMGIYLSDGAQWNYLGRHGVCVPERRFGIASKEEDPSLGLDYGYCSVAVISDIIYACYTQRSSNLVTLVALTPEGVQLRSATLADASGGRLIYTGGVLYLVTRLTTGAGTSIQIRTVTASSLAMSAATTLATTLRGSGLPFDVAPLESSNDWLLAHPETATKIRVNRMTGTSVTNTAQITTTSAPERVGVAGQLGQKIAVVHDDGSAAEVVMFADDLSTSAAVTVVTLTTESWITGFGITRVSNSAYAVLLGAYNSTAAPAIASNLTEHAVVSTGASVTAGPYRVYHYHPQTKPFVVGSADERQVLAWCHNEAGDAHQWDDQADHVLVSFEPTSATGGGAQIVAISYEHTANTDDPQWLHNCEVVALSGGRYATLITWTDPALLTGIDCLVWTAGTANTSGTGGNSRVYRRVTESGGGLYVSGGALYDIGDPALSTTHYIPENGFVHAPVIKTAAAAGGSLTAGTEYSYRAVYRRVDSVGRVHRSAPSAVDTVTTTSANKTVTVRVATLGLSGRWGCPGAATVAEIYRSWNGGPYYYVGSTGTVAPTAQTITYSDDDADADVEENFVLYTDLGVIPNEPPSGARLMCVGGNRMFCVGWRENVVQFSKLYIPTTPWEFCDDDAFRIFVPEPITALAWLDGALVIFSSTRVYVVTGDGPNDQGTGGFSDPRELPTAVGADSPHVVEVPQGLMFKGAGTIWLLPRGFGPPQPVGDDIQETLASYPHLRAAVRCANGDDDCTHFVLAASDNANADTRVAVWDNRLMSWSLDNIAGGVGAAGSVDGQFTWALGTWNALADIPVRQFSTAQHQDYDGDGNARWIESRWGFGDWRPWGPLGWGRLDRLQIHGEVAGICDMKVIAVTDGVTGMHSVGHTILSTKHMTGLGQFYAENQVQYPPGGAYTFDIYDSAPTGATRGLVLHSVAFSASEPDGLRRVSKAERF